MSCKLREVFDHRVVEAQLSAFPESTEKNGGDGLSSGQPEHQMIRSHGLPRSHLAECVVDDQLSVSDNGQLPSEMEPFRNAHLQSFACARTGEGAGRFGRGTHGVRRMLAASSTEMARCRARLDSLPMMHDNDRNGANRGGTSDGFLAAVVQLNCTSDADANWRQAEYWIRRAASFGAEFVGTPENANYLGPHEEKVRLAEPFAGPTCSRFSALASELNIHLLLGSFNERSSDGTRCRNTSVLFGPDGVRLAVYRKIHLFDVDVSEEVRFTESDTVQPGDEVVVAETALARVGMTICYDLRFPELYRHLVDAGAELVTVPSAFTMTTGREHWHALLRARAIETQCYVMAPAQWGRHDDGGLRESYGHALIVDPWGTIVAQVSEGPGVALAEISLDRVSECGSRFRWADTAASDSSRLESLVSFAQRLVAVAPGE